MNQHPYIVTSWLDDPGIILNRGEINIQGSFSAIVALDFLQDLLRQFATPNSVRFLLVVFYVDVPAVSRIKLLFAASFVFNGIGQDQDGVVVVAVESLLYWKNGQLHVVLRLMVNG